MQKKLLFIVSLMAVTIITSSVAIARSEKAQGNANNQNTQNDVNGVEESEEIEEVENEDDNNGKAQGKNKENKGRANAAEHRSTVATFVQSLKDVADREGGIGSQVRVIAQQQNESKEKVAGGIEAVENRGKVKTFLIGTDYKNLGKLRSEMVKVKNQTGQLNRLAEKAENEESRNELQSQAQVLQQEQINIQNFIDENEDNFSLFGWAVKLFQ
jgi:hypothetical protein